MLRLLYKTYFQKIIISNNKFMKMEKSSCLFSFYIVPNDFRNHHTEFCWQNTRMPKVWIRTIRYSDGLTIFVGKLLITKLHTMWMIEC